MNSEKKLSDVFLTYTKLLNYVLKKWKQLLLFTAIGVCLSTAYIFLKKDTYVAQLNFVSEGGGGGGLSSYAGIAAQFGIDLGGANGGAFDGENLIELMKSKNLITKTLLTKFNDNILMIEFYINDYKLNKKGISLKYNQNLENQGWFEDSLINIVYDRILKKNLSIDKFDKKLDFVYIKFEAKNQFFAKLFVETLAKTTIDFYIDYKNKKNRENVATIQHQVDSVRNLLYGNVSEIAGIRDLNVNLTRQFPQVERQNKEINKQVNAAVYEELEKHLQIAKLIMLKETPLLKIIDKPVLPIKSEKISSSIIIAILGFLGFFLGVVYYILIFFSTNSYTIETNRD